MRKIAAAAVAIPFILYLWAAAVVRRISPRQVVTAGHIQLLAMGAAVALLVAGMLLGLPAKEVAGGAPPSFAPLVPQAGASASQTDLPLDVAFQVQFTKPMNEGSVQNALTISPHVNVRYQWNATDEVVALVPDPHWEPDTTYVVDVSPAATDKGGLGLAAAIQTSFDSGSSTSGSIAATQVSGALVSPATAFQLTFTRPVKLFTVETHVRVIPQAVCPAVNGVTSPPVNGVSSALVNGACPAVNGVVPQPVCPAVNGLSSPLVNGACPPGPAVVPQPVCPAVGGVSSPPVKGVCTALVPVDIVGDDPTDVASQVFTITPQSQLDSRTTYLTSMDVGSGMTAATDSAGAALQKVTSLQVTTMSAPEVTRLSPQNGAVTYDTNQPISVTFTMAMDKKATAAAFTVTVNGAVVSGRKQWSEGNTVLLLTPRHSLKYGSTVVATVTTAARSADGLHLESAYSSSFTIKKRPPQPISYFGRATKSSPWYGLEVYYLRLMNCTRTGGWVTSGGVCSGVTRHTLPRQGRLTLNARISNLVSRPYAKYMADHRLLYHYLRGTTPHSRLCNWGGYCGNSWGENIASPPSASQAGMVRIETFYQNESWCRCEHYKNIMDGYFSEVGIGVWWSKTGRSVRVSIDFYG